VTRLPDADGKHRASGGYARTAWRATVKGVRTRGKTREQRQTPLAVMVVLVSYNDAWRPEKGAMNE